LHTSLASYNAPMRKNCWRTPRKATLNSALIAVLFVLTATANGFAAKEFVKPVARPAASYPAHEAHTDEGITVAVDPYDMPDKAQIFSVDYREEGLLPVFVIITNDTDQPITLTGMKSQLITVNRTKISPSDTDDVYRRLAHPTSSAGPTIPLPIPRKKVKGAVPKKVLDELQAAQFSAKAVEPHGTQSGFLFLDVAGISTPLAGAHFYLTGLQNAKGDELMYFEIPLEKYLSAPAKP
jgi:hypothetical protein